MSTKFFNNTSGNTLFDKLKGIAQNMANFDRFLAVVGFFRSSGYFKLRQELGDIDEIRILIGINIDNIFRNRSQATFFTHFENQEKAKDIYERDFKKDILEAKYSPEVEQGILQMCDDLLSGRLKMRIHSSKNLHAKFYLCLPKNHSEHSDGWVIMGSSNISESGLGITQPPRYELNVAMKDFDDVNYCHEEFEKLWEEGVELTAADIEKSKTKTYLGNQPTPYELYIKVLIDTFGNQVEDEFTMQLPDNVRDLKYQRDAVIQGYQILMQHNGLFLADVVGLGKTLIATMIAKRFVEANGKNTKILVIYPPALEGNWKETFKLFGLAKKAFFVSNGSLSKILEEKDNYRRKEEYDIVIVDEAHGFRGDNTGKYDELQQICKSPCESSGAQKKVMLLSATPLNNRPEDLQNQLLLFQDSQMCTIEGVPSINRFFESYNSRYKKLMRERGKRDISEETDAIYAEIRSKLIEKVTVRRTRNNILNDEEYRKDLDAQGIVFPQIAKPNELEYKMSEETNNRFYSTLAALSNGNIYEEYDEEIDTEAELSTDENTDFLYYARYRAVEFLKPEFLKNIKRTEKQAKQVGRTLAGIYRVHMVKRLESSFFAFKKSLATLLRITNDMLKMFDENKVLIIPEMNVRQMMKDGLELDEIIEKALEKGLEKKDIVFAADNFDERFRKMLEHDRNVLERLNEDWQKENSDPKFDIFMQGMGGDFFNKKKNAEQKLVLFSESVDTLDYLEEKLKEKTGRTDILKVTAGNRKTKQGVIQENFDANFDKEKQKNDFNIILTSDVLAEGVNLHRSNVIINYDSPWNATRLMQRIGRVNRIGSTAGEIYNYIFYPSQQGDKEIELYKNALIKLQGFHSAFGEDAQIFSKEEILHEFKMFNTDVKDDVDERIQLLREVRKLYQTDRKLYNKIKNLPQKSRVCRDTGKNSGKSIVFVQSSVKTEYYCVDEKNVAKSIEFLTAVKYLKAKIEEKPLPESSFKQTQHYEQVLCSLKEFENDYTKAADTESITNPILGKREKEAKAYLRRIKQFLSGNEELKEHCDILTNFIDLGRYNQLATQIRDIRKQYKDNALDFSQHETEIAERIAELVNRYDTTKKEKTPDTNSDNTPQVVISETFV